MPGDPPHCRRWPRLRAGVRPDSRGGPQPGWTRSDRHWPVPPQTQGARHGPRWAPGRWGFPGRRAHPAARPYECVTARPARPPTYPRAPRDPQARIGCQWGTRAPGTYPGPAKQPAAAATHRQRRLAGQHGTGQARTGERKAEGSCTPFGCTPTSIRSKLWGREPPSSGSKVLGAAAALPPGQCPLPTLPLVPCFWGTPGAHGRWKGSCFLALRLCPRYRLEQTFWLSVNGTRKGRERE